MISEKNKGALTFIVIVIMVVLSLIVSINTLVPSRDSGAFLYAGGQVLQGKIPYLDFWDHKPPVVYYINALAVYIGNSSLWGLWLVECLFLLGTSVFIVTAISKTTNRISSLFGLTLMLIFMQPLMGGGNRVEEYGLFFQGLTLLLFSMVETKNTVRMKKWLFVEGLVLALLFLLKPNLVAIMIAIFCYYFIQSCLQRSLNGIKKIIHILSGFVLVNLLVLIYFAVNRALPEMIDQVYLFNFLYATTSWAKRITIMKLVLSLLSPLTVLAGLGYLLSLFNLFVRKSSNKIATLAMVWLPLELLATVSSGREYKQYFLPLLIPLIILATQTIYELGVLIQRAVPKNNRIKVITSFLVIGLVILTVFQKQMMITANILDTRKPFDKRLKFKNYLFNNFQEHGETLELIDRETEQGEKIFIWGSEPSILFLSSHDSPGKYYYQFRLLFPGYNEDETKTKKLVEELKNDPPKLIIDASGSVTDKYVSGFLSLPPLEADKYVQWFELTKYSFRTELDNLLSYVASEYSFMQSTYHGKWKVYIRNK